MRRAFVASAALTCAIGIACQARSAIIIYNVPDTVQPAENVLIDGGMTGEIVFGETSNSHSKVSFQSLVSGVDLSTMSDGEARIEAVGGPLDSLSFFLTNGQWFNQAEFDLHKAADATGSVTVTFLGTFAGGSTSQTFELGDGNNWFAAETTDDDLISSVMFDTSGLGVDDIRLVRMGGIPIENAVPEPAGWAMMAGGFGLIGGALRRRRRAVSRA